jgi:hypothetical protein
MRAVVWQAIVNKALPHLIDVAGELAKGAQGRSASIAAANDVRTLRDQVAALSKDQQAQAVLIRDLTEQLNVITGGAQATAGKARQALALAAVAAVLSIVAGVLALIR